LDVDNAWVQEELETTLCEMLENGADSLLSTARFVGLRLLALIRGCKIFCVNERQTLAE
jgi:hypothetical protein